jgi:serine/threonine-protein kinase RIM15
MNIQDFDLLKPISKGAYGEVYIAKKKSSATRYAVKIMEKEHIQRKNILDEISTEKDIMGKMDSQFIVKLFYSLQSTNKIYFVMEFCIGGDLCSLLCEIGYFDETTALTYLAQVIFGVSYLHKNNIIHRDIKPENMLIDARGRLKLSDFGLSSCRTPLKKKETVKMTPNQFKSIQQKIVYGQRLPDTTPLILQKKMKNQLRSKVENEKSEFQSPIKFPHFSEPETLELDELDYNVTDKGSSESELSSLDEIDKIGVNKRNRELSSSSSIDKSKLKKPKLTIPKIRTRSTGVTQDLDEIDIGRGPNGRRSVLIDSPVMNMACPTPQRTPRRTKRRSTLQTRGSLINAERLGTPDYMPPELLERKKVCRLSDVWSIGVVFFEFLVGIPPFNDETSDAVFSNILDLRIDWPLTNSQIEESEENVEFEGMSETSKQFILSLLRLEPYERPKINDVISHDVFSSIFNVTNLEQMEHDFEFLEAPFIPMTTSDDDLTYFQAKNKARDIKF